MDPTLFYGVCYNPYWFYKEVDSNHDYEKGMQAINSLGARTVRHFIHLYDVLKDPYTVNEEALAVHRDIVEKAYENGIEVIGQSHKHFNGYKGDSIAVPERDMTEGSAYIEFLLSYEQSWYTMVREFPEITYWEIGNEWNHNPFLKPLGYKEDGTGVPAFTMYEKALISADLMYAATKGIRDGGNDGLIIAPSMAPVDGMDGVAMSDWLEYLYEAIETGKTYSGSTNPRDFFEALSWHPYMNSEPDIEWVENNNRLYQIAVDHGDAGIKVFLTEYGFRDGGNSRADATQAEWMVKAYELVRRYMPYVESLHYYRLFTDTSRSEDLYGLIHQPEDGFGPKAKGLAYQEMAGGKGDLYKFYMPLYAEGEEPEDD